MALSKFPGHKLRIIGQGMEKYLTLSFGDYLVFKDSLMFLHGSLASLGDNLLAAGIEHFHWIKEDYPGMTEEMLSLLLRKGVYPYDYMDSWDRFYEEQLPSKDRFYNKLRESDISVEDYDHAQKVCKAFKCKNLYNYHQLYLLCMRTAFKFYFWFSLSLSTFVMKSCINS